MGMKNFNVRNSLDFKRNPANSGMASLKDRLRQNANNKKWKGRREKHFGNNIIKEQNYNSPEAYLPANTRYGLKNNSYSKPKNEDQYMKNMRKVYHTIDYEAGRNKGSQIKKKKFGSYNASQSSSTSGSFTRSNKFLASNDFAFNTSQYRRSNKNFDTSFDIKGVVNNQRKPINNAIASGLSNLKRRKRQQEIGPNGVLSFRNSFHNSNASLSTLYKKNSGMNNFWINSSNANSSLNSITKRSKEKLPPQNPRQSLHLKLKKKIFQNSKKSIDHTNRREINMLPLNTFNRKYPNEKYSLNMKGNKDGPLVKPYMNKPGDNHSTSLDNYHTKSYENVMKSSSSIIFKNAHCNKPKPINGHINRKILAALANKNLKDEISKNNKRHAVLMVEESAVDVSDAYSYEKGKSKGNSKGRTLGSTPDIIEGNCEGTSKDKFQTTVQSYPKPHKQNSLLNKIQEDLNPEEDKLYGSEGKVNEYEDGLPKGFDSPFEYKAISPSPHLNTSAMSKEIALDSTSARIREAESKVESQKESSDFPLTAAKAIIHYGKYLSEYEESEILNYTVVYYINKNNSSEKGKVYRSNK